MSRLLLLVVVVALVAVWTVPALADLAIVQSWPVDTFPGGICYDSDRNHIWLVNDSTNEVRKQKLAILAIDSRFPTVTTSPVTRLPASSAACGVWRSSWTLPSRVGRNRSFPMA